MTLQAPAPTDPDPVEDGRGEQSGAQGGLLTVGETMALIGSPLPGRLGDQRYLELRVGGAESNVAIAAARLGCPASWVGRVGADGFGELVVTRVRGEGVAVYPILDEAPTSIMVKEFRAGTSQVRYYRRDGPGSHLRPDDVDPRLVAAAGAVHLTGITAGLGPSALATLHTVIDVARAAGVLVSFDVNHRVGLWSAEQAGPVLTDLVRRADLVFAGTGEAQLLGVPEGDLAALAAGVAALGPREVVILQGAGGSTVWCDGELQHAPARAVVVVDPVGAGDAFVGGYLAERLAGAPLTQCLETATACGAFAVTCPGDWEGTPTRADLTLLAVPRGSVLR